MGKIDAGFPGYELTQSGSQVQNILDAVSALSGDSVQELLQLLKEIQDYGGDWDDEENIAVQLRHILDSAVMENEVQKSVNDNNTYPPTSKAVKDAIETHANKSELEHPNKSVKQKHIDDGAIGTNQLSNSAVTTDKIANYAISHNKLSSALSAEISNAINPTELFVHISQISRAPKYALSDLCIEPLEERYCIPNISSFYIVLKNDTGTVFSNEKSENGNYKYDNQQESIFDTTNGSCDINGTLQIGKTYLCSYHKQEYDNSDTITRNISVVCEVGSELIDLITASKGWNGTWKYGTLLTHTDNTVQEAIDGTKAGDFYFNTHTYSVYYTHDGESWNYVGNLKGSIDSDIWAKLNSPVFTGEPTAPTPPVTNNSKQIATTEFVHKAIKDSEIGGDVSNNGYREISGQVTFNNVPDVKLNTPEILSQSLTITSSSNPKSVSISATGSVKWKGITYNATANTTFDATANSGSLDESFTGIYIRCNRAAPTQSSIVFSYDAFSVVTDEYIIIPIERVGAKYSMSTGAEGWLVTGHTPIGYDDVPTDAFALKSQLDNVMSKFTALENRVKALEKTDA